MTGMGIPNSHSKMPRPMTILLFWSHEKLLSWFYVPFARSRPKETEYGFVSWFVVACYWMCSTIGDKRAWRILVEVGQKSRSYDGASLNELSPDAGQAA